MALPVLSAQQPIVNPDRRPSSLFLRFMEETRREQIRTDAAQDETVAALAAIVEQLRVILINVQVAQQAANVAQETADTAIGSGTVSGFAENPSITVPDASWVLGPETELTGVVAGNLTITGTGPQQDDDVSLLGSGTRSFVGEYRVVEIVGMTETVVFTGSMTASQVGVDGTAVVSNTSAADAAALNLARSSTGTVTYRIDARKTSGATITELYLYLFVRRAA